MKEAVIRLGKIEMMTETYRIRKYLSMCILYDNHFIPKLLGEKKSNFETYIHSICCKLGQNRWDVRGPGGCIPRG